MNILEPSYRAEIDRVFALASPVFYSWRMELRVGDTVIPVISLDQIDRQSDYEFAHFDLLYLQVQVQPTLYQNDILRNVDRLKVVLIQELANSESNGSQAQQILSEEYEAFLPEVPSPGLSSSRSSATGSDVDDLAEISTIHIGLVNQSTLIYRQIKTSGMFYDVTLHDLIRGLLNREINGRNFSVTMVPPTNQQHYFQLPVLSATRIIKLPEYLQKMYGIYGSGINTYIKRGHVFIYPLYDNTRFQKEQNTLTIYSVPREAMVGISASWVRDDSHLYILSTGDAYFTDDSEHHLQNVGSSIEYAKVGNLIDNFRTYSCGQGVIPEDNRVLATLERRERNINNIRHPEGLMTDNPFEELSSLSKGLGSIVTLTWENANEQLLYPGMPVKLVYQSKGRIVRLYGTLIKQSSITTTYQKNNQMDNRYITNLRLTLWVEREYKQPI